MPRDPSLAAAIRLVVFDVDGTLVDSQRLIIAAMDAAFDGIGRPAPGREATLAIVGLSLETAIARLAPELGPASVRDAAEGYKAAFARLRVETGGEAAAPLYPGAREALERLEAAGVRMGVATGKARRGLDHLLDGHGLRRFFVTTQTADDAPSKPHPAMLLAALREAGVAPRAAAMVGDSTYDMVMAQAAGVPAIGVAWGYHDAAALRAAGAASVIDRFEALDGALAALA
jgi:phosphoglycolate phosphatase